MQHEHHTSATHPAVDAVRTHAGAHWWSIAAAVAGAAALAGAILLAVDAQRSPADVNWFTAVASELGQTAALLVVVALLVDRSRHVRWALVGAAAYVVARVVSAASVAAVLG